MKKLFVCFAVFEAMVLMLSCGEGTTAVSGSEAGSLGKECYPNKTCNSGLTCDEESNLCVEDSENPTNPTDEPTDEPTNPATDPTTDPASGDDADTSEPEPNDDDTNTADDSEITDSGDSTPDENNTTPDENSNDSDAPVVNDPCNPNPCAGIANSTGICSQETDSYVCGCNPNYNWDGTFCRAATKNAPCEPKPANTVWNDVNGDGTFTQTWNGESWVPTSYPSSFNQTPGTCTFKCASGSAWNGSSCDSAPTTVSDCTGLPENAIWNTTAAIVQTFDGALWTPSTVGVYDITPSQSECHFVCKPNYDWTGSQCVPATQEVECTGLPENAEWNSVSSITQTWNGTEWKPKTTGSYSTSESSTECRFKCKLNYNWSYGECVAATRTVNCTTLPFGAQWNAVSSITQTWNGETWIPSNTTTYNTTQSSTECRYKCKTNYTWNSTQKECIADTQTSNCTNLPAGAKWNTYSTVIQTWNGSSWQPGTNGVYNETASKYECRYVCDTNYTWNNSACKANSRVSNCEGKPENTVWNTAETISQTWNGASWQPTTVGVYSEIASTTMCNYRCANGYYWDSSECVNPCDYEPCEEDEHSIGGCTPTAWNEYSCECERYYIWDGSSCTALPTCSTAQITPCKYSTLIWSAKASSSRTWYNANSYCENLEEGGFTDWRMPNISELRTLIRNCSYTMPSGSCAVRDPGCLSSSCWTEATCDTCSYVGSNSGKYCIFGDNEVLWSSSPYSGTTDKVWHINSLYGSIQPRDKNEKDDIRCVRQQSSRYAKTHPFKHPLREQETGPAEDPTISPSRSHLDYVLASGENVNILVPDTEVYSNTGGQASIGELRFLIRVEFYHNISVHISPNI